MPRRPGYSQMQHGDPSFILQIAEKEQELLASQETVQVRALGRCGGSGPVEDGMRAVGPWV